MPYNLHGPSLTLTADERAREATRLLNLLAEVGPDELQSRLTSSAMDFLAEKWLAQGLLREGAGVPVSESQLMWLRDLWAKFQ